ncbi:MAG: Preprotein translocase, SecE subunit [Parcubacteria group bacterium GW2011_GWA2_36_10]|nr:MAG: Preprotein translocase, SecE subunit [Parcubacteria group bacterium GW2011_GWA2_36_10]
MNKLINYLKESKEELKKVSWPTRQTTINHTLVVIGVSVAVAIFLGGIDFLLSLALQSFIK